ncbi:MAG: MBL fold metallo-hydrolase [Clostridia bacterium]|nr:MBL fold metallo-hydrolase [Clostridia bacterium]
MKVRYLGTGAAEGIPALFCECEFCKRARAGKEKVRSRSQVVLDGELSIDFPPDAFYHNAVFGAELSKIKYLLVTHSHMDHFYAHDFVLRGYKYARGLEPLEIFGNGEAREVFEECTRREMREDVRTLIRFHELKAFEPVVFGAWRAVPLKAKHSSKEPFVFSIEKGDKRILHLTDSGMLPEEDFIYLEKEGKPFDLITFDCTFLYDSVSESARHMGVWENEKIFSRLKEAGLVREDTKKVFTHFSHNSAPAQDKLIKAEKEFKAIAAYDGMQLDL